MTERAPGHGVSLFDDSPFFERALLYGAQNGILDRTRLATISQDAPKGMVQLARYFGNEFLRADLEVARARLVNLVSLDLLNSSGGDLRLAAESLREHSLLSRSKAGADLLKALIGMPRSAHFGIDEEPGFRPEHIPLLADWSLKSFAEVQVELERRKPVSRLIEVAIGMASGLGMDAEALHEAAADSEAVIRTSIIALARGRREMPDWVEFERLVAALCKKDISAAGAGALPLPAGLPAAWLPVVEALRHSVLSDLPRVRDSGLPLHRLFDQTPAFMGRYFWLEDPLAELDHHHRSVSAAWGRITGNETDENALLTVFLCLATAAPPRTLISETQARALLRKARKSGLNAATATAWIRQHAPPDLSDDLVALWEGFIADARKTLLDDRDTQLGDALALLRRECHVQIDTARPRTATPAARRPRQGS